MSLRGVLCLNRVMCTASLTGTNWAVSVLNTSKDLSTSLTPRYVFRQCNVKKINVMCSH